MRKIERDMCAAIASKTGWQSDNTTVVYHREIFGSEVFLYGHRIATVSDSGGVCVDVATLRKWPTNTTLSRLRALGVDVCRKGGEVYLRGEKL